MGRKKATDIIALALDTVGNVRISSLALSWLNLLLNEAASTHRFPDLEKQYTGPVADGDDTVPYPLDYGFLVMDRKSRAYGKYVPGDGSTPGIILQSSLGATRDSLDHSLTAKAIPGLVADDRQGSQWILHPVPSPAGTLYLNYQSVPADIGLNDVPWYPVDSVLVSALVFLAELRQRGKLLQVHAAIKEQAKRMALGAPSRAQLWQGGSGSGLDPTIFR
jgi:hypothetical protein